MWPNNIAPEHIGRDKNCSKRLDVDEGKNTPDVSESHIPEDNKGSNPPDHTDKENGCQYIYGDLVGGMEELNVEVAVDIQSQTLPTPIVISV